MAELTPELENLNDRIAFFVTYPPDEASLTKEDAQERVAELHHVMAEWAMGHVFISQRNVQILDVRLRAAALQLSSFTPKEVDLAETLEQVKGTLEWL